MLSFHEGHLRRIWKKGALSRLLRLSVLSWYEVYNLEEQTFKFMNPWIVVFQNGAEPDMKHIYQNAYAVLDVPRVFFWLEILEAFPDCKVILTEQRSFPWKARSTN